MGQFCFMWLLVFNLLDYLCKFLLFGNREGLLYLTPDLISDRLYFCFQAIEFDQPLLSCLLYVPHVGWGERQGWSAIY